MRKLKVLIIFTITVILFIMAYLFIKPAFNYLSVYLSRTEEVKANILIVEGWLPDYALEMAYDEFKKGTYDHVVTTGLISYNDYIMLGSNGFLIFFPKHEDLIKGDNNSKHTIKIRAFSQLGGEHSAHFNVFLNESLIGDFLADNRKKDYTAKWEGKLSEIDSLMIQFTNDSYGDYGDRNLYVKEVIIDNKIKIPYLNYSEYDIDELDGKYRIINNSFSAAQKARTKLLSLGIDSSLVIAVPGDMVQMNRTLTSSLAFRDWLSETEIEIKGINIISMGTHSRRTWMTYNRVLDEKYDVGIISLPDSENTHSRKSRVLKTLRETLGIVYYWIILIPY